MNNNYDVVYNVGLFDDLHNYLPAILYDHRRFQTVSDLLGYVHTQTQYHFNLFNRGSQQYQHSRRQAVPPPAHAQTQQEPNQQQAQQVTDGNRTLNVLRRETFDITPLFTTQGNDPLTQHGITALLNPQTGDTTFTFPTLTVEELGTEGTTPALDTIMNIIQGGLLRPRGAAAAAMEPVVVRPTQEQMDTATIQRIATVDDEQNNCSICQESFTNGQTIRQINHCRHSFHRACINPWFDRNVHCPVCRFDIRESE